MCTEAEQPMNMIYLNLFNILQSAESLKCGGGETTTIGCLSEFDNNRSMVLGKKRGKIFIAVIIFIFPACAGDTSPYT